MRPNSWRWKVFAASAAAVLSFTLCTKQLSDAEKLARGRELVKQMSDKLASSSTLSFSTQDQREIAARDGQKRTIRLATNVVLRRPDRVYASQTGDRTMDAWYDGKYVTVAVHSDKVYGQIRSPETVDGTLEALSQRFGMVFPIGDFLHSKPETMLLSDDIKGGYVDRQNIDGTDCHHLAFAMPAVDWELWLPAQGDLLPKRIKMTEKAQKGSPVTDIRFTNWNLAAVGHRRYVQAESARGIRRYCSVTARQSS